MWFNLGILGLVAAQRLAEVALARRNARALMARGGIEYGARHYPAIVMVHAAWLAGLGYFSWGQEVQWPWLAAYLTVQAVRAWVIATLGEKWTTRIIVVPGEKLVRHGPYRYLRHPNYAVVVAEIFILPMVWGLLWFALAFTAVHGLVIAWRIRVEERALAPLRPR
jgi:methyltransferase